MIGPLILGVLGVAVLLWLGNWQIMRMGEKNVILAEIAAVAGADPVGVPLLPDPIGDRFLAVQARGKFEGSEIHVLASNRDTGAGYRIISVFVTQGRRLLVDRGFIPIKAKNDPRPGGAEVTVVGNLHWPDELDKYIPEPDLSAAIWFAREVPAMAANLGTEPVLIVARQPTGDNVRPFPVNIESIPNDHLNYAITWFLLAAAWFGMTVYLLLRIKRQAN